jgi:hypothetical protein
VRRLVAVTAVLAAVLAACGDGEDAVFRAGAGTIELEVGERFMLDLEDDPDDDRTWQIVIGADRLDAIVDELETLPGVKQVERIAGFDTGPGRRWVDNDAEVFLSLDITPEQRAAIDERIASMPDIGKVTFVSHAQQHEMFVEYFRDQPEYLENVAPEDLPESLRLVVEPVVRQVEDEDGALVFEAVAAGTTVIEATYRHPRFAGVAGEPERFTVMVAGDESTTTTTTESTTTTTSTESGFVPLEVPAPEDALSCADAVQSGSAGDTEALVGAFFAARLAGEGAEGCMTQAVRDAFVDDRCTGPDDVMFESALGPMILYACAGHAVTGFPLVERGGIGDDVIRADYVQVQVTLDGIDGSLDERYTIGPGTPIGSDAEASWVIVEVSPI